MISGLTPEPTVERLIPLETTDFIGERTTYAVWRYTRRDPYALSVDLGGWNEDGTPIIWTFARDLARRGLSEPTGKGDVQFFPTRSPDYPTRFGRFVIMNLYPTDEHQELLQYRVPRVFLKDFLNDTRLKMPYSLEDWQQRRVTNAELQQFQHNHPPGEGVVR